jgi:phthiodiolone/phenolphthiodiolone dimycocerosates ketoreductase
VKVGIMLPTLYPWAGNEMTVRLAESMGADSVWAPDHLMGMFHPALWPEVPMAPLSVDPDSWMDPFVLGGAVGRTTSVPYGICVTDSTRRGAADVARAALTLQHVCPGGFHLGVGSGEAQNLTPFGYPFDRPVARCEEFLAELRTLLDTGRMPTGVGRTGIPHDGDGPRVWVAGHGPRMLRLTGEYGDGWLPTFLMAPEEYGRRRAIVLEHAAAAGRPAPECGMLPIMCLGESRERLAEMFEATPIVKLFTLTETAETWRRHGVEHPQGDDCRGIIDLIVHGLDPEELRDLAAKIPFSLVDEVYLLGNVDELVARIEPYARAGCEHVVLGNTTGIVGGMAEIEARAADFVALGAALREL